MRLHLRCGGEHVEQGVKSREALLSDYSPSRSDLTICSFGFHKPVSVKQS